MHKAIKNFPIVYTFYLTEQYSTVYTVQCTVYAVRSLYSVTRLFGIFFYETNPPGFIRLKWFS